MSRGEGVSRSSASPRGKHTTRESQERLAPTWNIQGRLGSKRRMVGRRGKKNTTTGTKVHRDRDGENVIICLGQAF